MPNITNITENIKYGIKIIFRRKDTKLILFLSTIIYFLIYLFSIGDLSISQITKTNIIVSKNIIDILFRSTGYFRFEPIVKIQFFVFIYLFSPINTFFSLMLSGLVGLNISFLYIGIKQPKICKINYKGFLASIPALFSGTACCGPILFIILGIQATGLLISLFQLLLPTSIILLIISLILITKQINNQKTQRTPDKK